MSVLWATENDKLRGIFHKWVSPDLCASWVWGALWQQPLPSSSSMDTTSTYCGGERGCNWSILIWLLAGAFPARCTVVPSASLFAGHPQAPWSLCLSETKPPGWGSEKEGWMWHVQMDDRNSTWLSLVLLADEIPPVQISYPSAYYRLLRTRTRD